ncbi:conserved unknown protein [Ectocarpus siliculosus]|uniref:SGNH hydrolase-type esterase domain-containing protein n=1 Tax=Ectocarpus siliculosus TaxID=2880 RepID=D7FNS8_ECTSI|nr:conserved unknown protein [Ectocarpus siliculosus]|eukprot:CBJ30204.1 conserved unknown protein [Ectocarpus siliculosus]
MRTMVFVRRSPECLAKITSLGCAVYVDGWNFHLDTTFIRKLSGRTSAVRRPRARAILRFQASSPSYARPGRKGLVTCAGMTKERVWATAFFMLAANRVHLDSSSLPGVFGAIPDIDVASSTDVLCWETHGEYELDCFHDEPLVWKQYPLTQEMLQRTVPYNTSGIHLHRAFNTAKANGVLKVVAIGGSVTFGRSCESPKGLANNACAWPHRLDQWFRAEVGDFKVEVVNEAVPGEGMIDFLHKTIKNVLSVDVEVDLVIVDFGVNDAILDHFDLEDVKMAHETFISHVRNAMTSKPALLYAESFIAPRLASLHPPQGSNMAEVHANVTQKYDIPMVRQPSICRVA